MKLKHRKMKVLKAVIIVFTILISGNTVLNAQKKDPKTSDSHTEKPKLVVGIVVDQMRYDYLTRFKNRFGDTGFTRLINEGFTCENNHFNYIPTYTGPGHASVFTGTTPSNHGIISNNWYNKFEKQDVYCAGDDSVESVGTASDAGKMSPHRMKTTTMTDQNRLHTQMRGKTVGISLKDRGAILPAGHTANGAYWFHGKDEARWITSSFYMDELPKWVSDFNASGKAKSYLKTWDTFYNIDTYTESSIDLTEFEGGYRGKEQAVFPYDLAALADQNGGYDIIKESPYGNSLTTDFAIASLDGEQLGQDEFTDFLTVSYSSTDYLGHNFGVNAKETEDAYIRLDQDLSRLLTTLDNKVGAGNYTVFLTSDHGAVHVPAYLSSLRIPSGYFDNRSFAKALKEYVALNYGREDLIEDISNYQVFLSYTAIAEDAVDEEKLQKDIANFALQYDQVDKVFTRAQMQQADYTTGIGSLIQEGFHQKRSGDVFMVLDPSVISYGKTGSTHGSGLNYDTHAPLIFYGKGIKKGKTYSKTRITDIVPTISALLGISFPNSMTGEIISEVLE